ncbi:TetR family transcriptional regulator [Streptomyces tuirus]|uniref:TetR family transcriptional regulator n=1 Tax=Streptomyces tuirus TaxID=68278 RepID=A0A941J556_9ACTN|nr:TetR family transcriptional regulator [Streptomyces tuirus]
MDVTGTPDLRERRRLATQADIEDAALDLFERQGYERTTVLEIAAAAGVSQSTFFRYFATKEDAALGRTGPSRLLSSRVWGCRGRGVDAARHRRGRRRSPGRPEHRPGRRARPHAAGRRPAHAGHGPAQRGTAAGGRTVPAVPAAPGGCLRQRQRGPAVPGAGRDRERHTARHVRRVGFAPGVGRGLRSGRGLSHHLRPPA